MVVCCSDFDHGSTLHKRLVGDHELQLQIEHERKKHMFRSTLERYAVSKKSDDTDICNGGSLHPGDIKMNTINDWLNKLYRSPGQIEFHQMFLATCLRIIYGNDYEKERHRVMIKYGFESKKQQALICAPRRFGKTFSVSFFAIVVAIILPDIEISIFSPGKRQSVALMNHIYTFMKKLGETDRVIKKNEEKMVVRTLDGKESKINAYPSAVKTLKGVSGTIIILEEVAALDPEVLFEVVCPLHQLDITSLIGISTITTEDNFFTTYLKMKDKNDQPLFAVKYIYLACKPCRDKGTEAAAKCNHNNFMLPGWSSQRKARTVKCMMKGQEAMLAREIGGIANSKHQKAFLPKLVASFMELPRFNIDHTVDYNTLFISIDPNAGGNDSHFAICTILVVTGLFVIIGMESFPSKTASENHSIILQHVAALDETGLFNNTLKVFILEANLGYESEHIEAMLNESISNFLVISGDNGRVGFTTTNQMKQQAVENTRVKLGTKCLRLASERYLTCVTQTYPKITSMLFDQMSQFSEIIKQLEHAPAPKKQYSGKTMGPDDLMMTVLFGVMWIPYFYNSTKYIQFI